MTNEKVMLIELSAENKDDSSKSYVADINLPASLYEIDDAIERCRGYLEKTDIMPFGISKCERVPLLSELRFDSPNLYELNFLAKQINEFDNTQLAVYNALLPLVIGENYESELISIKDVINLTYSVNDYSVAVNIFNDTELGEMLVDNNMVEGIENLSDEIIELLDYGKVGEAHRMAENGVYVNDCYVSREGFEIKEVFNGETVPVHEFDNYMFRLCLSRYDGIRSWINIPLDENSEQFIKNAEVTEFNLVDFISAIPQIVKYSDKMHPTITMDEINRINQLCQNFQSLDEIQSIKFKAALYFEGVQTLDDINKIQSIMNIADSYNLKYFNVFSFDFAKDYLKQYLDESFPKEYLELINTQALGDRLMNEYNGKYTPYGILLKSSNEQNLSKDSKHEFMLADFLSKHVLFTEDRLKVEEVPEGLYKYEFRSGAEYTYATLEEKVGVDFSGTILSKVPFDLGEDEYIDLEKEVDGIPDFLDVEMSIDEFINSDFDPKENLSESHPTEPIKMKFYFPLCAKMQFDDCDDPQPVDTDYIIANMCDVESELEGYTMLDGKNMADYYNENSAIKEKLVSMDWGICEIKDIPYGYVDVVLNAPLNDSEVEEIKDWISGQNSDGLGEGFEQREIETDEGGLYVSFWDSENDYFIYTQEEMDEYLEQSGGMNICQ